MLRRAAAGVVLGVSLFVASLAWSSFIALRTVFDPSRSAQIADDLWEDDAVRGQIADNIATAITVMLPEGVEVSEEVVEAAALVVLDSPALRRVVDTAFVQTHSAFLGEGDLPRGVQVGEVSQIVRDTVVELDPRLDASLPAAPDVTIELPTDRIPDAGPVRRALQLVVPIFALTAAVGIAVALLTTSDRPGVLRRAGTWAISSSAFVLVVSFGVPWLVARLVPSQAEVLAALIKALLAAALTPSIVLAVLGVAALGLSFAWRAGRSVASAPVPQPAPAAVPAHAGVAPRGGAAGSVHMPQVTPPPQAAAPATVPVHPSPPVTPPPAPPAGASPAPDSGPAAPAPPASDPLGGDREGEGLAPRWVPGVGWVQHPEDTRPPKGARWEPGIGYILDRPPDPLAEER
jgi:hypothetical protein